MPDTSTAPTATNAETRAAGSKILGFILGGGGAIVDKLFDLNHFALKDGDGNVGLGVNPAVALDIMRLDQSVCRVRLRNAAAGGEIWDMVGGYHNVSQAGLTFFNVSGGYTALSMNAAGIRAFSQDAGEGGITLAKHGGLAANALNQWVFSHRNNGVDLLIYGYDGATFKNFMKFDWANNRVESHGPFAPGDDNALTLGASALRWSVVYAGTGTINTSDAREKTPKRALTAQELAAATRVSREIGIFQFLTGERLHVGIIAQEVWAIMADEGLIDPVTEGATPSCAYAFLCYDEWDAVEPIDAVEEVRDEEGEIIVEAQPAQPGREAGNRFGIRPDQLALFLIAAQEARLSALETS